LSVILFLAAIIVSIVVEGIPIFKEVSFFDFVFGQEWHPTSMPAQFGIFPLMMGSLAVTLGALVIAIPLGLGTAIYISEIASSTVKEMLKPAIELLAGIPSVVYGLFGMAFLSPFLISIFNIPNGLNIFSVSIVLGVMVVPIIASMSEDALSSVPRSLREASLALGATRWETITKVVLPAAKPGIISSIIIGFGRAVGETMVVLMIAGGSAQIPTSIFDSVRPMPAAVASEMGETVIGSPHFHALYGIASVLFAVTFFSILVAEIFSGHRSK